MKCSLALVPRIPNSLKPEDKKIKLNLEILQKQQEGIVVTLREAGVRVVELPIEEGACTSTVAIADLVFVLNQTALICRPYNKENGRRAKQLADVLSQLGYRIVECAERENGKKVQLCGSDVLVSGKEIFVGLRKNYTNLQGASVIAKNFPDFSVVPLMLEKDSPPLNYYVSIIDPAILCIGSSKQALNILARLEDESSQRYTKLTMEDEGEGVACVRINDRIVFRKNKGNDKLAKLKGVQLWAVDVSEITKIMTPFRRFCVLI